MPSIPSLIFKETALAKRRIATYTISYVYVSINDDTNYRFGINGTSETGEQVNARAVTIDNLQNGFSVNIEINGIQAIIKANTRVTFSLEGDIDRFRIFFLPINNMTITVYVLEKNMLIPNQT